MKLSDKKAFADLIASVYAYHRVPVSAAIIRVFWRGCERFDLEQITKAIDQLTADAEAGKFPPKIGDITRVLEGTHTDRAQLAWGKTLEAISSVGRGSDVVFDDPAIHAVVEDLGGWVKLCSTTYQELGYVQHRFCESYRAYVGRKVFEYPRRLSGDNGSLELWARKGLKPPPPVLIGEPARCEQVYRLGSTAGKTAITYLSSHIIDVVARALPQQPRRLT